MIKLNTKNIKETINNYKLSENGNLVEFIRDNKENYDFYTMSRIAEMANSLRNDTAAYYTDAFICEHMVNSLPDFANKNVRILEPAVGTGNFLPFLFKKYQDAKSVELDLVDLDNNALNVLSALLLLLDVPQNFHLNFINDDFLQHNFDNSYDIVLGNPPYQKVTDSKLLAFYRVDKVNQNTKNTFIFFIEKALKLGTYVSLVVPKSLLYTPEYDVSRNFLAKYAFENLTDYGEAGFKGVKIETISFIINTTKTPVNNKISVVSYINNFNAVQSQDYIFPSNMPSWLLYRNAFFDDTFNSLSTDVFTVVRDRQITKKHTKPFGKYRVLKSRNISSNCVVDIPNYDSYVDDPKKFAISKYMNMHNIVMAPNLTYYPRACFLPPNTIVDGSVALLLPKYGYKPKKEDLSYFGTKEFSEYYRIVKNYGTRSLNLDRNAVFFWGIKKGKLSKQD